MNSLKWIQIFKNRITLKKRILLFVVLVLLYGESICFLIDRFLWCDLSCKSNNHCIRILLVADPQIIGENDGDPYTNGIRIWDSDRYLYYSYQHAISHFKPSVIVFLGDLMDEGSTSTTEQYFKYLKRFRAIFNVNYPVQYIYIPGDNDIGGEFGDWITPEKIFRFEHILSENQSQRIEYNDLLTFYKVNRLVQEYRHISSSDEEIPTQIRIVLSHIPLTNIGYIDGTVKKIKPNVIFSAHNHVPYIIEYDNISENREYTKVQLSNEIYFADLKSSLTFEYVVPTCSYRMGVPNMGYGAAVLDTERGELKYTIYWLHSRLQILWLYLILLISLVSLIFMVILIKYILNLIKYLHRKNKNNYSSLSQNLC